MIECGDECNLNYIGPLETAGGMGVYPEGDVCLCPEGTMYVNAIQITYSVDPATGICSTIPGMPPLPTGSFLGGLACAGNGILYGAEELNLDKILYKFDVINKTITSLGSLPFDMHHGMFYYNNSLYGATPTGIAFIDTLIPSASYIVFPFPTGYIVQGVTVYGTCNTILLHGSDGLWSLMSMVDGSITPMCPSTFLWLSLTGGYEFVPSGCLPSIDLDCNDSSGATGFDFNSPSINCLNEDGVPIADIDVIIRSPAIIEEMTISISPAFMPDGADEFLQLSSGFPPLVISGQGTSDILITNPSGTGTMTDYIDAIHAITYWNTADPVTPGLRNIEVSFTTVEGDMCETAIAYVNCEDLPEINVDLGDDVTICSDEVVTFDAGNTGAFFEWSNNQFTQTISTDDEGTYSVTVTNGHDCPGSDTVELVVIPTTEISLTGDPTICFNETGTLTIMVTNSISVDIEIISDPPGPPIELLNTTGTITIQVTPTEPTAYMIQSVIANEAACVRLLDSTHFIEILPIYMENVDTALCDGEGIFIGPNFETTPGFYGWTYQSEYGCDSVVSYHLTAAPSIELFVSLTTCDPNAAGVFESILPNENGCDTLVHTTVTYFPPTITALNITSCVAAQSGVTSDTLSTINGCDSIIITTTTYLPPVDTTQLVQTTCDSGFIGVSYLYLTSHVGCDSIVRVNTIFADSDTTQLSGISCIVSEIGIFTQILSNVDGCDSLVITTVTAGAKDTTFLFQTSCDSSQLGVHETLLVSFGGCDSLVITSISFSAIDTSYISNTTCKTDEAGEFVSTYINQFGCDSVVIKTVSLDPSDAETLIMFSCSATDTGTFVQHLSNIFGCDSVITTIVNLSPSQLIFQEEQTCIIADTGIFNFSFINQYGCDSTIIRHVTYTLVDTTLLSLTTCDPMAVGTTETNYLTADGCDSLVIATTTFAPLSVNVVVESNYHGYALSCEGSSDGSISAIVKGTGTYSYSWSNSEIDSSLTGLSAGMYEVTVSDVNGCTATASIVLTEPAPIKMEFIVSEPDCFSEGNGYFTAVPSGGVAPFQYSLNGNAFQPGPTFDHLQEGTYQVTMMDVNGCSITEFIWINQLLQVHVTLGNDIVINIGDTSLIEAVVNIPHDSLSAIHWFGISNQACPTCLTQQVAPLMTTSYFIEVISVDGCSDTDTITVNINEDESMYIPNVFSPNGDGINDLLEFFVGNDIQSIASFTIYDRYGGILFQQTSRPPGDPSLYWDGRSKDQFCNPGVFVYVLKAITTDGKLVMRHGDVTLVR